MSKGKPNAVLRLIDAAIVRGQLKKMGAYQPGNVQMKGAAGTRKTDRKPRRRS